MAKYINADKLKQMLFDKHFYTVTTKNIIAELIATDSVVVSNGKWEFKNDGAYGRTRCYCTACGKHSGIGGIRKNQLKPYCPNCGAKMEGEKSE